MRVLWSIHLYPPKHNCGSEWMAHNINRYLYSRGHEIRVILHQAKNNNIRVPYTFEGIEVYGPSGSIDQYRWADVIMTHLEYTALTVPTAKMVKRPVFHFVHNDTPYQSIINAKKVNVVYNSEWIAEQLAYNHPSMVFHPFVDMNYINVNEKPEENEYITLINLNENKGGGILYEIAERLPNKKFLAVRGSYDEQIIRNMPNVTHVPNTKDIREYYKRTRLLIMPSRYESWGLTASEAMCNGIPVISTCTPGLMENLGSAGCYVCDRDDIGKWVEWINRLDNPEFYGEVSKVVRQRASCMFTGTEQYQKLENFLHESVKNY